jgi:diguanylate cyclase (GGDEF)-like protein
VNSLHIAIAVIVLQQGVASIVWTVLAAVRVAPRATAHWAAACALLTLGMVGVALRGEIPPWLGDSVPNIANQLAFLLVRRGMQLFTRQPPGDREHLLLACVGTLAVLLLVWLEAPRGALIIAGSGLMAYTLLRTVLDIQLGLRDEFGRWAALACSLPLLGIGAGMAVRVLSVLVSGTLDAPSLTEGGGLSTALVLAFLALGLLMNVGMTAMVVMRLINKLHHLSQHDALTQLVNRRVLEQSLALERERLQRHGRPFALLSVDIDHFKSVNDQHGHAAGDAVLVGVAAVLKREARVGDTVARMGGEEFALLLPDTGSAGAAKLADRLRRAVAEAPHPVGKSSLKVTVSVGLSVAHDGREAGAALWRRVDAALYRAKAAGRNRVETAVA